MTLNGTTVADVIAEQARLNEVGRMHALDRLYDQAVEAVAAYNDAVHTYKR